MLAEKKLFDGQALSAVEEGTVATTRSIRFLIIIGKY
jgi:hypothetical protein